MVLSGVTANPGDGFKEGRSRSVKPPEAPVPARALAMPSLPKTPLPGSRHPPREQEEHVEQEDHVEHQGATQGAAASLLPLSYSLVAQSFLKKKAAMSTFTDVLGQVL